MASTITPVLNSPVDGMKKLKVGHIYQLQYVRAFVCVFVRGWGGGTGCTYKGPIL